MKNHSLKYLNEGRKRPWWEDRKIDKWLLMTIVLMTGFFLGMPVGMSLVVGS